jgi:hypothetical protein
MNKTAFQMVIIMGGVSHELMRAAVVMRAEKVK